MTGQAATTAAADRPFAGKVVIITGAGGGLGSATARAFAQGGAHMILSDIHDRTAGPLAIEMSGLFVRADVTREEDIAALVAAAVAEHGRLDVMINNAGQVGAVGSILETRGDHWSSTLAVLLDSVFFGMKHAGRAMKEAGHGGAILSTASVGGIAALTPHAYAAAKHGVVGLTRSVAAELAAHGIRVNAIAPGSVPTPLTASVYGSNEAVRDASRLRNPLGTVVEADEIADAFIYLASAAGRNITGQVLTVDAGLSACPLPATYYQRAAEFLGGSG